MKKLISILLLLLLLLPVCTATASDTTYELPDLSMTIDAPDGWLAYTRDINPSDPNLVLLGYDEPSLKQMYIDNDIYFNAIDMETFFEIVVTMTTTKDIKAAYDYNYASEDDVADIKQGAIESLTELGATISDTTTYKHNQALFIVIDFVQDNSGMSVHSRDYNTVINGQAINITMHSYTGPLTDDAKQTLLDTVDSVTFTKVTERPKFDYMEILYAGIGGAVIGGIVGLVRYLTKKKKGKKLKAAADTGLERITADDNTND